jgi:hypothetical protein
MPGVKRATVDWLLQPSNASARWHALRLLLDKLDDDPEVVAAREKIPSSPWVKTVMRDQQREGWWIDGKNLGTPKFNGTMFRLEALADLGTPGDDPRVQRACELFLERAEMPGEGFAPARYKKRYAEECLNGRMLFTFNHFGYGRDPRVKAAAEWLIANQMLDGGWNCSHHPKAHPGPDGVIRMDHVCSLDKPHHRSSLFSTLAALKGLGSMKRPPRKVINRGVEFLMEHRLYWAKRSRRVIYGWPPPLLFPPHLFYDGLQPLRVLAMLGVYHDARLDEALDQLESRADSQGMWPLDGVPVRPNGDPSFSLKIDPPGRPNKWITVHALTALRHFGRVSVDEAAAESSSGRGGPGLALETLRLVVPRRRR